MNLELINLIKKILKENLSGVLVGEKSGIRRELFVENEVIVFSKSTAEQEHLGNILYSLNIIDDEQYKSLHSYIEKARISREKLGKKLVQEGIINASQLFTALKYQLKKVSLAMIYEEDLKYSFLKRKVKIPPDSRLNVPLVEVLLEAIEYGDINNKVKSIFNGQIRKLEGKNRFEFLLSMKEKKLLAFLEEPKELEEITNEFGSDFFRSLFKLYTFDFIDVLGEGRENMEEKDEDISEMELSEEFLEELENIYLLAENKEYSKILPKDPKERKRKFLELVKKFHPDRLPTGTPLEIKEKAEIVFDAINKASDIKPESDEEDEKKVDQEKLVRQTIMRAKILFKQQAYQQAVSLLESVIKYVNTKNYEAYFVLALGQSKIDQYKKAAEENFLKAISLNQWSSEPYYYLAKLYEKEGLKSRAVSVLEKAIQKFPNDEKISNLYKELTSQGKGLFSFLKK